MKLYKSNQHASAYGWSVLSMFFIFVITCNEAQATTSNTISYTANSGDAQTSFISAPSVSCGTGFSGSVVHQSSNPHPLTDGLDTSQSCVETYLAASEALDAHQWQIGYDSAKKFIETCPYNKYSVTTFDIVGTCAAHLPGSTTDEFRANYLKWSNQSCISTLEM